MLRPYEQIIKHLSWRSASPGASGQAEVPVPRLLVRGGGGGLVGFGEEPAVG